MDKHVVDVYVLQDTIKRKILFAQGTDALPVLFMFRDYKIPEGASAEFFVQKPSGKCVNNGAVIDTYENSVYVDIEYQMVSEPGTMYIQLRIKNGEKNLFTFDQPYEVKRSSTPMSSESSMPVMDETILNAQKATKDALNAAEHANDTAEQIMENSEQGLYSASIKVGEVLTGDPGSAASVENVGSDKDAIFEFSIPRGFQGPSGVTAPANGMFTLWVNPANGNLYVDFPDGEEAPPFRYDGETGNLYYDFERGDGTVSSLLIGNVRNPLINNTTTKTAGQGALDAAQGTVIMEEINAIKEILKNVISTDEEAK